MGLGLGSGATTQDPPLRSRFWCLRLLLLLVARTTGFKTADDADHQPFASVCFCISAVASSPHEAQRTGLL